MRNSDEADYPRGDENMTTGQTILTIGAFVLLTTILQGLYNSLGNVGSDISSGQDGILADDDRHVVLRNGANGLAFDKVTDTTRTSLCHATSS